MFYRNVRKAIQRAIYGPEKKGHEECRSQEYPLPEEYRQFMILGIKDFPVNPNDYIHAYTERDNPYMFSSKESAQKFIGTVMEASKEKGSGDPLYFRIVELKSFNDRP